MICSNCNVLMRFVMRFDGDKMYRLRRCPKCYFETKQVPLILEEETRQNNYKSKKKKYFTTVGLKKKNMICIVGRAHK